MWNFRHNQSPKLIKENLFKSLINLIEKLLCFPPSHYFEMISCEYGQAVISVFIDLALAKIARKNAKMARLEHLIEIVNVDLFAVDLSKT